jgi:hypothetical protein
MEKGVRDSPTALITASGAIDRIAPDIASREGVEILAADVALKTPIKYK